MTEKMQSGFQNRGKDARTDLGSPWEVIRNKYLFQEINERCNNGSDYILLSLSEYSGVSPRSAVIKEGQIETNADTLDGYKICHQGDIIMNIMLAWKRATARSEYEGIISPAYCIYRGTKNVDSRFYHYLFRTDYYANLFRCYSTGIIESRLRLYSEQFFSLFSLFPPIEIQNEIVKYLDPRCIHIDAIISEAKASIEEYKAWKASIIFEAITKGIESSVETMTNDSKWIPETPVGTKISRVGLHYNIILGKMLCPDQIDHNYTLESYYCAANVHFSGIETANLKKMWFSPLEKAFYKVEQGDLLVVEGGAGAGGSAIVRECSEDIYIQNSIMIVRGRCGNSNSFLKYILECLVGRGYVDYVCNKATIPHFTKEKLGSTPFPVFSPDSQKRIVEYLDERCSAIDSLVEEKKHLIADLESYKKSLVFEVVTGKRKVC